MASLAPPMMTDREWRLRVRIDKLQDEIEDKDARIAALETLYNKYQKRTVRLKASRKNWKQKYRALRLETGTSSYRAGVLRYQRISRGDTP